MTHLRFPILVALGLCVGVALAADEKAEIQFSAGVFDVADNDATGALSVELRGTTAFWILRPILGAMATGEHSGYAYAGLLAPWALDDRWTAGLSLAAGAYRRGDGKDLGSGLEFRSQAEVSYRLDNGHRLGVSAAHLSNAGVGHRNPGTNILMLATYAVPLD